MIFKQKQLSLFPMIDISIVSGHIHERNHITVCFLTLPYLFLISIFFLSCFHTSFDHLGFPWDVYFLFVPAGLFILFDKAFNQCFPHNIYFAFLCSTHKGKHVRVCYLEPQNMEQAWSSEVVVSEPAVIRGGNFLVKYFHLLNPVPWFCLGSFLRWSHLSLDMRH